MYMKQWHSYVSMMNHISSPVVLEPHHSVFVKTYGEIRNDGFNVVEMQVSD